VPRLTPDPSFYATATEAATAAPEQLAYVATIGVGSNGNTPPDALGVLDLDRSSPSYGQIVGRTEMPNVGDELHHFGWNACSSALCP
jgi:methanethiol oxidase